MNAENSLDLFTNGRMGTIADGVTSLLEGQEPPSPPSSLVSFLVYALIFGLLVVQARGIVRSVAALRSDRLGAGRLGAGWHIGFALALNLAWATFVLVLLPKQLGLPLLTLAQGFPDLALILLVSAVVALGWGIVRTAWAYTILRKLRRTEGTAHVDLA